MRRAPNPLLLLLPLGALGCTSQSLGKFSTPPNVSIVNPLDGALLEEGALVELVGVARDDQDPPEALQVQWASSVDGELGGDPPDTAGNVFLAVADLSPGDHVLTLRAFDLSGESGQASIQVNVGEGEPQGPGTAPTVLIASPADGDDPYLYAETVTFVAAVTDPDQPNDSLAVSLVSRRDGLLWEGTPAADGRVDVDVLGLSIGEHEVTLQAYDEDGNSAADTVMVEILDDGRPRVVIDSPADGSTAWTTDMLLLQGEVDDAETDTELLALTWESNLDGVLMTGFPDSSGLSSHSTSLTEGLHVITLSALDGEGKVGSDSVTVEVRDALNVDDDRDGYTENEGDCDDGDPSLNPGRTDTCDDLDNDCDGALNDPFWDSYEPNDSSASPHDLGEVDGSVIWTGSSVTLAGQTLHAATDEDWFRLDVDDDAFYDNVNLNVYVTGLPSAGMYKVELLLQDGSSWNVKSSTTGFGSLYVGFTGDVWDGDEDIWAVRVSAITWAPQCTTPYTLQIDA